MLSIRLAKIQNAAIGQFLIFFIVLKTSYGNKVLGIIMYITFCNYCNLWGGPPPLPHGLAVAEGLNSYQSDIILFLKFVITFTFYAFYYLSLGSQIFLLLSSGNILDFL